MEQYSYITKMHWMDYISISIYLFVLVYANIYLFGNMVC